MRQSVPIFGISKTCFIEHEDFFRQFYNEDYWRFHFVNGLFGYITGFIRILIFPMAVISLTVLVSGVIGYLYKKNNKSINKEKIKQALLGLVLTLLLYTFLNYLT